MSSSVLELLAWIAVRPRTYGEAMAAWRSNCPRQATWEDACAEGLIQVDGSGRTMDDCPVTLTAQGTAALERQNSRAVN